MYVNAISAFSLVALASLFGTSIAQERWRMQEYEDRGCSDRIGDTSDKEPSGCTNVDGHSVPVLSLKADGEPGRCGWTFYGYAGHDCAHGGSDIVVQMRVGICETLATPSAWRSYDVTPNPC
ncbi:hypothetical protein F4819DRAFT_493102 [Hypoxylon fuscum]|nr:hypothetical protein F4819DRAFT_493102 [Hypoxylon fuscum]